MGSLILKNDKGELDRLSEWVKDLSAKANLSGAETYSLRLAMEEIVSNVMKYAYGDGVDLAITVHFRLEGETLEITIEDTGPAFNPLEVEPPKLGRKVEDRKVGGLGIHLVRKIIDRIHYARQGEKNILSLIIRPGTKNGFLRCCS